MPIRMRDDLFNDRYREIEERTHHERGDVFKSHGGKEHEIVDIGLKFETKEIAFWLEADERYPSTEVVTESTLSTWEKVEE